MIITFLERKKTPMYESKKCRLGKGGDTKGHDLNKIENKNMTIFANQVSDSSFSSGGDENNESDTWPAKMEH